MSTGKVTGQTYIPRFNTETTERRTTYDAQGSNNIQIIGGYETFNEEDALNTKELNNPGNPEFEETSSKTETINGRKITKFDNGSYRDEYNGFRGVDKENIEKNYSKAAARRRIIMSRYTTANEIINNVKVPDNGKWGTDANIKDSNLKEILQRGTKSDMQAWIDKNKETLNLDDLQIDALLNNLALPD